MKLKNNTESIISLGKVVILPGEVGEITDPFYIGNGVIDFMVNTGRLNLVSEKRSYKKVEEETAKLEESDVEDKAEEETTDTVDTEKTKRTTKKTG